MKILNRIKERFMNSWPENTFILAMGVLLLMYSCIVVAGDNHIHIDQVSSGDNFDLTIDQIGYDNKIDFSFNHNNNTIDLLQYGNDNYFGYTELWGSGYNWGGDIDGLDNELKVRQKCSS